MTTRVDKAREIVGRPYFNRENYTITFGMDAI
jgi:hypothetical protein